MIWAGMVWLGGRGDNCSERLEMMECKRSVKRFLVWPLMLSVRYAGVFLGHHPFWNVPVHIFNISIHGWDIAISIFFCKNRPTYMYWDSAAGFLLLSLSSTSPFTSTYRTRPPKTLWRHVYHMGLMSKLMNGDDVISISRNYCSFCRHSTTKCFPLHCSGQVI